MNHRFLKLEWKQYFRSTYWQKNMALNILLVFFALYFIVMFLFLGVGIYPILEENFPEQDPFDMVNNVIYYWLIMDLIMRFFFQKLPVMNVKPLLILPIKRSRVVRYILRKSVFSFFNFLPLFAIIPFGFVLISKDYNASMVYSWIMLMLIFTLTINFLNFIIESKTADSELSFLPLIAVTTGMFALNYFEVLSISKWLAGAIGDLTGNFYLMIIPVGILGLLYFYNFSLLKNKLYIDQSLSVKAKEVRVSEMNWTRRFGAIAPFLQLDLKLLWRNKRPRSAIFILVIGLLYGLIFYPNPTYKEMVPMFVFVGIFVTGIFLINFGQFIPAWDSGYYKMLMSQNIQYKEYLRSKFTLMILSTIIMFCLSIPYVYFGWKILLIHFAAMVYNIGVNAHILIFFGSFNRKKIDLTQRAAFNYQGTGAVQWLISFPLLLIPMGIFYFPYKFINFESGITALIVVGLLGIVLHQKIMTLVAKKYINSKYKMIHAFSQDN